MANQRQIKKRVSSIKNIGKITSALEMVSASKVQKAQEKANAARPYAEKVYELVQAFAREREVVEIPLLRKPEVVTKSLYVLVTSNKGLAGSLNTALLSLLKKHLASTTSAPSFITVGAKGRNFALSNGELAADFSDSEPFEKNTQPILNIIIEQFTEEKVDEIYLVYNDFISLMKYEPKIKRILPLLTSDVATSSKRSPFVFEPSAKEVLVSLLNFYLENQLRDAILEGSASEHAARMMAMKSASDNSKELAHGLSLEYNKARQSAITNEIADVVTSSASLSA